MRSKSPPKRAPYQLQHCQDIARGTIAPDTSMTADTTPALRILSIIPPMTQLNTPYPSTAYLTGFLRSRGFHAEQMDLSIGLALQLLSVDGLRDIHRQLQSISRKQHTAATRFFAKHFEIYQKTIASAI